MFFFQRGYWVFALLLSISFTTRSESSQKQVKNEEDSELRVGLYVMTTDPIYVHAKRRIYPIPYLAGSYSQFYAQGTEAGYLFNPKSSIRYKFFVKLDTQSLDPQDSQELNGIHERGFLGFAGVKIGFNSSPFKVSLSLGQEIFFRAKGQRAQLKISTNPMTFWGNKLDFTPFFRLVWDSQKINQYYYGVAADEEARSNFSAYQTDSSITPHIGYWLVVSQIKPWSLGTSYSFAFLHETVRKSPLVDKSGLGSFVFFTSYTF